MKTVLSALALLALPACAADEASPADPIDQTQPAADADFEVVTSAGAMDVVLAQSATLTVQISRKHGFTGPVSITLADLPAGVTASSAMIAGDEAATIELTATSTESLAMTASARVVATAEDILRSVPLALTVLGTPGMLDPTFASGGRDVRSVLPSHHESNRAVVALADGSMVTAGLDITANQLVLVTFDAAGKIAPWGPDGTGVVRLALPAFVASVDLERDSQGRLVASAYTAQGMTTVMRLTADGILDESFGGGTTLVTGACFDLALDTNDRPVLICERAVGGGFVRLTGDAQPDGEFGDGQGWLALGVTTSDARLTRDASGRIVAAMTDTSIDCRRVIARLSVNGALDPSLDLDGIAKLPYVTQESLKGLAVLGDEIYVGVDDDNGWGSVFHVAANGAFDTTFGTNGSMTAPGPLAVLAPQGDYLVVAASYEDNRVMGAFDATGAPRLASSSWAPIDLVPGTNSYIYGITSYDGHRVVLVGTSIGTDYNFVSARVWL